MERASAHAHFWQSSDFITGCVTVAAFVVEYLHSTVIGIDSEIRYLLGAVLILIAWGIIISAKLALRKFGQKSGPGEVTTQIVTTGIFAWSGNPIYVGVALLALSVGIIGNSIWVVGSVPISVLLMQHILIVPEERYLEHKFGVVYQAYKECVRRWF